MVNSWKTPAIPLFHTCVIFHEPKRQKKSMFHLYRNKKFNCARVQLYLHIIAALTSVPIKQQALSPRPVQMFWAG